MWACYVYSVVFSPAAQPDHSRLQAPPGAVHEQNGAETRLDYVRREREGPRRMVGEGSRHCLRWLTLPYSESRRGVVLGSWYRFCQDLIWPPQTTRRGHRGGGRRSQSVAGTGTARIGQERHLYETRKHPYAGRPVRERRAFLHAGSYGLACHGLLSHRAVKNGREAGDGRARVRCVARSGSKLASRQGRSTRESRGARQRPVDS